MMRLETTAGKSTSTAATSVPRRTSCLGSRRLRRPTSPAGATFGPRAASKYRCRPRHAHSAACARSATSRRFLVVARLARVGAGFLVALVVVDDRGAGAQSARERAVPAATCEGCRAADALAADARIAPAGEPGTPLVVTGVVYRPDGRTPAAGVSVYASHTNAAGVSPIRARTPPPHLRRSAPSVTRVTLGCSFLGRHRPGLEQASLAVRGRGRGEIVLPPAHTAPSRGRPRLASRHPHAASPALVAPAPPPLPLPRCCT